MNEADPPTRSIAVQTTGDMAFFADERSDTGKNAGTRDEEKDVPEKENGIDKATNDCQILPHPLPPSGEPRKRTRR